MEVDNVDEICQGVRRRVSLLAAEKSKLFRPSSRRMKDAQYFDGVVADTIRDDVGSAGNDQLPGAGDLYAF